LASPIYPATCSATSPGTELGTDCSLPACPIITQLLGQVFCPQVSQVLS